nr:MAG TPA: hypothetical protein [Caudoviricetes sp.]
MRYIYALPDEAAKAFRKEHPHDEIVYETVLYNFAARIKDYVLWDAEKSVISVDAANVALAVYDTILGRIDAVVTNKAHAAEYRFSKYEVVTVD